MVTNHFRLFWNWMTKLCLEYRNSVFSRKKSISWSQKSVLDWTRVQKLQKSSKILEIRKSRQKSKNVPVFACFSTVTTHSEKMWVKRETLSLRRKLSVRAPKNWRNWKNDKTREKKINWWFWARGEEWFSRETQFCISSIFDSENSCEKSFFY